MAVRPSAASLPAEIFQGCVRVYIYIYTRVYIYIYIYTHAPVFYRARETLCHLQLPHKQHTSQTPTQIPTPTITLRAWSPSLHRFLQMFYTYMHILVNFMCFCCSCFHFSFLLIYFVCRISFWTPVFIDLFVWLLSLNKSFFFYLSFFFLIVSM